MGNELNSGRDSDWFINVIDLISHSSLVKDAGDATVEQVHCRTKHTSINEEWRARTRI